MDLHITPFILAPLFGIIPAIIWLLFWLREDPHPEPLRTIILSFLSGAIIVFIALPLQRLAYNSFTDVNNLLFTLWASIEEVLKFSIAWLVGIHSKADDEPIDPLIYMIIVALGFVSMENTLFLFDPLHAGDMVATLVTGNLRFIGASLIHILSSATVGVFLSLSFYKTKVTQILCGIGGLILAIALHTYFNLSIMNSDNNNLFIIFGVVWVGIIILLLLFERIKHINPK
jgi:RsiW-degrading membrane proteinase PrsW (M82 family)